jgi:uncharacterized protein YhaN
MRNYDIALILHSVNDETVIATINDIIQVLDRQTFYNIFSTYIIRFPTIHELKEYKRKDFIFTPYTWDLLKTLDSPEVNSVVKMYDELCEICNLTKFPSIPVYSTCI